MYSYPYTIERDDGTMLLQFPDVAIAHTVGRTAAAAISHAEDALVSAIAAIMDGKGNVPRPSPARGRPTITLSPLDAAKVELYRTMRTARVTKAELARRLDCHSPQVDRLLDLLHPSKLDQLERAFAALGKTLEIRIRNAA
ncbi:MAG TPA: type II toxin-antitoxin system HicB family antitoxin [Stellaceae bacterium]|jgi:antitoxin HicB|nr:type II toxin-antitoxin system HicB family antitoxin [Stellaceae bacterium]